MQIGSREYTYAGGSGVYTMEPLSAPNAKFRETIEMGEFTGTTKQFECILDEMRTLFQPNEYHVLTRNCNCFADCFIEKLVNKRIPGYVNRLAGFGNMVSCCLPPDLNGQQNPIDPEASSNSSLLRTARTPSPGSSKTNTQAFKGTGQKLGGSSNTNSTSSSNHPAVYRNPLRESNTNTTSTANNNTNAISMKKMVVG